MIPTQTMTDFPEFSNNGTKTKPDNTKYAAGFAEADQLPYEWLNWFLNRSSKGISGLNAGLYSVEQELNNVLAAANIQPAQATANQLLTALNYLIQAKTGALADLTTTEKDTLVAAINELNENKSPKAGSAELTTCAKGVFGDAAAHGVDTEITEGSSNLPTSDAVNSSLADLPKYPDYTQQITLPSGTTEWTATEDCYLNFYWGNNVAISDRELFINNVQVTNAIYWGEGSYGIAFSGFIKKGDIIKTYNLANTYYTRFFKLR